MYQGWALAILAVVYIGALFLVAWVGDRSRFTRSARPLIYSMSLAVYCTSWTFFGSVGLASSTGYDFIPVYLGPILVFLFGVPLILRITRLAKSQNLTSVSDFLAARYGKSPAVAAIVTSVAVVGTLPYIALQLKAIVISTETLLGASQLQPLANGQGLFGTALLTACALALFAILFGTRHTDATEHQSGLMLAVATESVVKLGAFIAVGVFVIFSVFGGFGQVLDAIRSSTQLTSTFDRPFNGGMWLTVMFLSSIAVLLLPRQFHVAVVENHSEKEVRRASWLFPLYLVAINLFVIPIAAAGLIILPQGIIDPDMFVLALPLAKGSEFIVTVAYIGGLSAATAMVVVESIALSIMISNGLVVPLLLKGGMAGVDQREDFASLLLAVRRVAIVLVVAAGFVVYLALGQSQGLAAIGLISFAAIAQLAPAFFGGLIWRRATARGAIAGILVGFAIWAYTLLLPWIAKAGHIPSDIVWFGPFGIGALRPQALFYLTFDPLTHGVLWSMLGNIAAYIVVSLWRAPEPIERMQAHLFVLDDMPRTAPQPAFRLWRTSLTVGDLQATAARYLGAERTERSFADYAAVRGLPLRPQAEADINVLRFTERLLTSAIGAASARLVMSLLLRRGDVGSAAALKLLDDATEALQYNRDLLQSALDQVRHGLGVFDKDMNLVTWNRQFRELLALPSDLCKVGSPLRQILGHCAERGDFGSGAKEALVADRCQRFAGRTEVFLEYFDGGRQILEFRTSPIPQPQGGTVCTFTDITERVAAARALERANETLERRVHERTQELVVAMDALKVAKAQADEANLDKTRFLAAASHDLMQPLNAARLYASSLVERQLSATDRTIAHNIDTSLTSVEEIISALVDISRLDAGRLEPQIAPLELAAMLRNLEVEFSPLAHEKGLALQFSQTDAWIASDRRLMKRMLQNLIGNAIKYTTTGAVSVDVVKVGQRVDISVRDTGPGIPAAQHALIFKEFQRGEGEDARSRGLGLGLSIVQRIGQVLDVPIKLSSAPGQGSTFSITVQAAQARPSAPDLDETAINVVGGLISGLVVVCIENEQDVLSGMRQLLTGWGCEVILASGKANALDAIRSAPRAPSVILADYHLDHETGVDAIEAVRAFVGRPLPAIVITAAPSPELQQQLGSVGIPLLRKPLKAAALRALLHHFAGGQRAAAE